MATTKQETVSGKRLQSFVERVEKLDEERKAIGADIRDVLAEAKGVGYDVKTIRWLVAERKIDSADRSERDNLRDTYAHAIGMAVHLVQAEGLSLREAGRRTGVSKSSIHRALAVPGVSQDHRVMDAADLGEWLPTHDPETGVIDDSSGGVEGHAADAAGDGGEQPPHDRKPIASAVTVGVETGPLETIVASHDATATAGTERSPDEPDPQGEAGTGTIAVVQDDLQIPAFLDRRPGARAPAERADA